MLRRSPSRRPLHTSPSHSEHQPRASVARCIPSLGLAPSSSTLQAGLGVAARPPREQSSIYSILSLNQQRCPVAYSPKFRDSSDVARSRRTPCPLPPRANASRRRCRATCHPTPSARCLAGCLPSSRTPHQTPHRRQRPKRRRSRMRRRSAALRASRRIRALGLQRQTTRAPAPRACRSP